MRVSEIIGLVGLLQGCALKHETDSSTLQTITVISTVPYARLIAASVIEKQQVHEGYYWAKYTAKKTEYRFVYKAAGETGDYNDDFLIMQVGKHPKKEYVDWQVVGGVYSTIDLRTGKLTLCDDLSAEEQAKERHVYLESMLAVTAEIQKTENIKELQAIVPP